LLSSWALLSRSDTLDAWPMLAALHIFLCAAPMAGIDSFDLGAKLPASMMPPLDARRTSKQQK
jgi:hypothetical protein